MKRGVIFFICITFLILDSCFRDDELPEPHHKDCSTYVIETDKFGIFLNSTMDYAYNNTQKITEALAFAHAEGYDTVRFPEGEYVIASDWETVSTDDPTNGTPGIVVPSDIVLDLRKATFRLLPNNRPRYSLFFLYAVSNVTIMGGHLIGDRLEHDYTYIPEKPATLTHEFGYGIKIAQSEKITIKDVKIEQMTGDGVIIGGLGKYKNSSHVTVTNCELSDCRRQGITIYGGNYCELSHNHIHHIKGTPPQAGIDIEIEDFHTGEHIKIHNNLVRQTAGGSIVCGSGDDIEVYKNTVVDKILYILSSTHVTVHDNKLINTRIEITYPENVHSYNNQIKYCE